MSIDLTVVCERHLIWWSPYFERTAMMLMPNGTVAEQYADDERDAVCALLKARYEIRAFHYPGKGWAASSRHGMTPNVDNPTELAAVVALADRIIEVAR